MHFVLYQDIPQILYFVSSIIMQSDIIMQGSNSISMLMHVF